MADYRKQDGANPFDLTPQAADNAIFSGGQALGLADPRIVAKPTLIEAIWADVKQPRRAIPASIRLHWDGDPSRVAPLLAQWRMVAGFNDLDLAARLEAGGDGSDVEAFSPIAMEFVALFQLAVSIKHDGLINPITVIEEQSGRFVIESGERRWLAFHLINQILGTHDKIPAIKSDGVDFVWRQASENTARRQLNAIGMARQLALLIMAARDDQYRDYGDLVQTGGSDRRFYAQIADGNVHRVPKGMGERIQGAMGGLSEKSISDYRALLRLADDEQINDVLWLRADVEDWPLLALLSIRPTLHASKVRELILGDRPWTLDDLRELAKAVSLPRPVVAMPPFSPHPPAPSPSGRGGDVPASSGDVAFARGMRVKSRAGFEGVVRGWQGGLVQVTYDGRNDVRLVSPQDLTQVVASKPERPATIRPGAAMKVILTEEVGVVKALLQHGILLDVAGDKVQYADEELLDLGMNYDEWLRAEIETPPLAPPHSDREGNYPQTFEGGYVETDERVFTPVGSSKAHSAKQTETALFDANGGDFHWYLSERIKPVLHFLKLSGAVRAVETVQNMTAERARELREHGTVKDRLDEYHDTVSAALVDVLGHFDEALERIHNAAFDE